MVGRFHWLFLKLHNHFWRSLPAPHPQVKSVNNQNDPQGNASEYYLSNRCRSGNVIVRRWKRHLQDEQGNGSVLKGCFDGNSYDLWPSKPEDPSQASTNGVTQKSHQKTSCNHVTSHQSKDVPIRVNSSL